MNIFTSIVTDGDFTAKTYFICTAVAFACGILAALTASFRNRPTKSFIASLVLLPVIVETVIIMVNGNIGTGIAVAGAFSLVRFRSAAGRARDISAIFFVMTAGLACAAGYIGVAIVFTLAVCAAMLLLALIPHRGESEMDLRITVPEDLSFNDSFTDVFNTYTTKNELLNVKTSNMGSLYKLTYRVRMKNPQEMKSFIDDLRCRNGNLEISLCPAGDKDDEL